MLALYHGVGKYVSENTRNGAWGTGAIENISEQLRRELPGLRGFSPTSIKKMRNFYEQWNDIANRPPMADDLQITEDESILPFKSLLLVNRPPMASDFNWHDFFALSFSHHDEILSKQRLSKSVYSTFIRQQLCIGTNTPFVTISRQTCSITSRRCQVTSPRLCRQHVML